MQRNCRLVAYHGDKCYMMGYKLTKPEAKERKRELMKSGFNPDVLFIDEYTRRDYETIYTNAYRVKVVFRAAKYEYLQTGDRRLVDREQSIIVGQGLSLNEARYLHGISRKMYKENVPVVFEMYAQEQIEMHFDCTNDHILEDLESRDIKLSGKGLKKKVTDNLSFTVLGHAIDKDSRWVTGQIDFTSYKLKSETTGKEVEVNCINPYQASGGATSLPNFKNEQELSDGKVSKFDDGRGVEYLKSARHELSYSQFIVFLQSLRNDSHYLAMFRYLKRVLYVRNDRDKRIDGALYCLSDVKPVLSGYQKAPRNFIQQLIDRTV